MKILNRPMFRYGGPIKEGIMNGIQEPKRGRVDGPGSYAGRNFSNPIDRRTPVVPVNMSNQAKAFENIFTTPQTTKEQVTQFATPYNKQVNEYIPPINTEDEFITVDRKIPRSNEIKKVQINNPDFIVKGKNVVVDRGRLKGIKRFVTEEEINSTGDNTAAVTGGKSPFNYTVDEVIKEKDTVIDTEGNRKKSINNILEKLGYARSQKNALYDALIKGGQRIAREGLGKEGLVADLIQDTSTSYDKPEKIREAAELMQVQQDLKLEGIDRSKTNLLEENYNFLVNKFGKSTAMAITTKSDKTSDDAYLRLKGLPDVTTNEAVLGAVRSMVDLGEGGIKKDDIRGEISKKKYKDGIDSFKNSTEFNREDKGPGVYVYEGVVIEIDANGKHEIIKTFGSINDKAKKFLGIF